MTKRADDGQTTAFVTIITLALLLFAGLVYDGGQILAAKRRADNEAGAAARAGAAALSEDAFRRGASMLDTDAATAAAHAYLETTGHTGSVSVDAAGVRVTVTFSQPLFILGAAGVAERSIVGHGEARPARGVLTEDEQP